MYGNNYLVHYGVLGMKWGQRRQHLVDAARNDRSHKSTERMLGTYKSWVKEARPGLKNDPDKLKRLNDEASQHVKELKDISAYESKLQSTKFSDVSPKDLARGYKYLERQDLSDRRFNQRMKKKYGW